MMEDQVHGNLKLGRMLGGGNDQQQLHNELNTHPNDPHPSILLYVLLKLHENSIDYCGRGRQMIQHPTRKGVF
jgi:hypothetical protein